MSERGRVAGGVGRAAIVAVVGLLSACGASPTPLPPSGTPQASSTAAAATATTRPKPSATPLTGWQLLPVQPDLGRANLVDVTTFQHALYAVGNAATDAAPGVIWTSADGETWRSAAGPGTSLDGAYLEGIAAGDPGLVVAGLQGDRATVLFSPDGSTWSTIDLPEGKGAETHHVTWAPAGYVATGSPTGESTTNRVLSWWSQDGRTWSRITDVEGSRHPALDVAAAGPTGYLALGTDAGKAAVWRSGDGRKWRKVSASTPLPEVTRPTMRFADGQYLLPSGDSVWATTDGSAWTRSRVPAESNDVFDVINAPDGTLVAIGRSSEGNEPGEVSTADPALRSWTALPEDSVFDHALGLALAFTPDGRRLVAVGNSENDGSILVADAAILGR
jgi:hypothetical protein